MLLGFLYSWCRPFFNIKSAYLWQNGDNDPFVLTVSHNLGAFCMSFFCMNEFSIFYLFEDPKKLSCWFGLLVVQVTRYTWLKLGTRVI